jgi:hypothetical protein
MPLALNQSNGSCLVGNQDVAEFCSNGGTDDCNLGHPSGRDNAEPNRLQGLERRIDEARPERVLNEIARDADRFAAPGRRKTSALQNCC